MKVLKLAAIVEGREGDHLSWGEVGSTSDRGLTQQDFIMLEIVLLEIVSEIVLRRTRRKWPQKCQKRELWLLVARRVFFRRIWT